MYGMSDGYTAWALTMVGLTAVIAIGGLYLLLAHVATEMARVRVALHREREAVALKEKADSERIQQASIHAVEEMKRL